MTLTDIYGDKIKKLKVNDAFDLKAADCSHSVLQALYRAANKMGVKISVRNSPDGMRLWRIK